MTIEQYESLDVEDQKIIEEDARSIAWDWISDHHDDEDEETCCEIEDEIWMDFIKDVDEV